jgi:DNA-binding protein H-NS
MKGRKVAPKFRSPDGETWAGRGARPRWLSALIRQGHKIEEFAIVKTAAARKSVATKRSRRKKK